VLGEDRGLSSSAAAAAEPDPAKTALFKQMADAAEEQAGIRSSGPPT
jgi:hypothetical protein